MNNNEYVELQGKKQTAKKKVGKYSLMECEAEIQRLKRCGHEQSKYYGDIVRRKEFLLRRNDRASSQ